jgi:hypothetical protein
VLQYKLTALGNKRIEASGELIDAEGKSINDNIKFYDFLIARVTNFSDASVTAAIVQAGVDRRTEDIKKAKEQVDGLAEVENATIAEMDALLAKNKASGEEIKKTEEQIAANEKLQAEKDAAAKKAAKEAEKRKQDEKDRLESIAELLRSEKQELEFKKDKLLKELELSDESKTLTATEASAKKVIIEKYNQDVADLEKKAIDDRKKKIKEDEAIVKEAAAKALKDKITELEYLKFIKLEDEKLTNKEKQEIELQFQEDKANIILDELKSQAAMIKAELEQLSADTGISLIKPLTPEEETDLKDQLNLINEEIGKVKEDINGVDSEQEGLNLLNGLGLDEEGMAKLEFSFQTITASISAIGNLMGAITQRNKKLIQEQVDEGVISQDQADKQIAKIELRAFKRQKALQISMAAINTAQAILMALAQTTDFTPVQAIRIANAATIGVLGGVQVATIAAQKFAEGGVIQGASHAQGGVPFSVAGRGGFEAEGGEFIHKTKAVDHYGLPFMNALNNMQLPKVFAEGGYVAPMTSSSISQQVSAGVSELVSESQNRSIQVLNVESDFSNLQNKVNNVESARTY